MLLCATVVLTSCQKDDASTDIIPVSGITLNKPSVALAIGAKEALVATIAPQNASNKGVIWATTDPSVATVSETGVVTAVKGGSATITAIAAGRKMKNSTCVVTVAKTIIPVSSVTLDQSTLSLNEGGSQTLTAVVLPADASNQSVIWSSSDATVALVSEMGEVTALKAGTANIIATSAADNQKTAVCALTVSKLIIAVESVTLNKTTLSLVEGKTETLTATVLPAAASDKSVLWSSSDNAVATVSATGEVVALKAGTTNIIATSVSGQKPATCVVTVTKPAAVAVEYTTSIEAGVGVAPAVGDGTQAAPYQIATAENLRWLKEMCADPDSEGTFESYYLLTTNVHVTADEWSPLYTFEGHFDGGNHKITGKLSTDRSENGYGFFGLTAGAVTIKNLHMEAEVYAPNMSMVGGILGIATNISEDAPGFQISNCSNSGNVTGYMMVAGIVSYITIYDPALMHFEQTLIDNCINKGTIHARAVAGGIAGGVAAIADEGASLAEINMTIKNCRNEGAVVAGAKGAGGILVVSDLESGTLYFKGCTNTGSVSLAGEEAPQDLGTEQMPYGKICGVVAGEGQVVIE